MHRLFPGTRLLASYQLLPILRLQHVGPLLQKGKLILDTEVSDHHERQTLPGAASYVGLMENPTTSYRELFAEALCHVFYVQITVTTQPD